MAEPSRNRVVVMVGLAQTLAWASSFYLPAILAQPMAADLRLAPSTLYALLSMALLVSAVASPWAGRRIDRHGGRPVLLAATLLFAAGLVLLALAQGMVSLVLAWLVLGLAMGTGLYDAAFATLVHLYGRNARTAITGITLLAGFASTVGWPLSSLMQAQMGWRGTCLGWAALHLLLALPLYAAVPRRPAPPSGASPVQAPASSTAKPDGSTALSKPGARRRMALLLALLFTLMGFVSTSVATHLPALLQASGLTLATAVAVAALAGPAQVTSRLCEITWLRRLSPLVTARLAALGHPVATLVLLALGPVAALPFVLIHGLGNGLLTIVRGTLPLAIFGAAGYGARQGWIALPGRIVGALSPWLFGLALQSWGVNALWLSALVGLAAFALLLALRLPNA
jgi:predicted MFS family arabinose efflux permease